MQIHLRTYRGSTAARQSDDFASLRTGNQLADSYRSHMQERAYQKQFDRYMNAKQEDRLAELAKLRAMATC